MKKIIIPTDIEEIKLTLNYADAYLIGIKDMCISNGLNVDVDKLKEIGDIIQEKELFINLNKNMENKDIDNLTKILLELNQYNVKGIFYYDVAVVNLSMSLDLYYNLVWANEHSTTNYDTINFWYSFGVNYTVLSSDITINEVMNIKQNTDTKLIAPIFGYQQMFVSKRHIVKNYLKEFNLEDNSDINYMEKEGNIYPIVDNNLGTVVYTNYILNGVKEYNKLKNNNVDYILIDSFNISSNKFLEVLRIINSINDINVNESYEHINSLFDNTDTGFLYKETVARVKKNEK